MYKIAGPLLAATFAHFRECGRGRRECQVLWISSWDVPEILTKVVHSKHQAHAGGFVLDGQWISDFWQDLGNTNMGIRVQVHTHPMQAFHSPTDDRFPIIHKPGFLSLVIPNFGMDAISLSSAYLTEIQPDGRWHQVPITSRLEVT
jgi:hypothetical protein